MKKFILSFAVVSIAFASHAQVPQTQTSPGAATIKKDSVKTHTKATADSARRKAASNTSPSSPATPAKTTYRNGNAVPNSGAGTAPWTDHRKNHDNYGSDKTDSTKVKPK